MASPTAQRTVSTLGVDTVADSSSFVIERVNSVETIEAAEAETTQLLDVPTPSTSSGTSTPQANENNTSLTRPTLVMRLTGLSGLSGLSTPALLSPSPGGASPTLAVTTPQSPATAILSPRVVDREMLNRARLQAPPSYDVPNRVIERSPLMVEHLSPENPDDNFHLPSACVRDDYFSRVRVRAHTVSHPSSSLRHQQHQFSEAMGTSSDESQPETPRYSLEFPSHVPHHWHLEQHHRARTLVMASSPASLHEQQPWDGDLGSQSIRMEARSFSQPYYSSSSLELGLGGSPSSLRNSIRPSGGRPVGMRSRASTLGESSKLLIQRMQTLWKKSPTQQQQQQQQLTGLGLSLRAPAEAITDEPVIVVDDPTTVTTSTTTDETTEEDAESAVETTEVTEQGSSETEDATKNNLSLPQILLSPPMSLPALSSSSSNPVPVLAT